jgi:hypothetical protein
VQQPRAQASKSPAARRQRPRPHTAPQRGTRPSPTTILAASVSLPPAPSAREGLRPAVARTRGRGVQPARYARRIDRSGRRARSSPRCVSFRIPCLKRSAVRPSLHCEPARGRARLRSTRTWGLGSRNVHPYIEGFAAAGPYLSPRGRGDLPRDAQLPDPRVPIVPRRFHVASTAGLREPAPLPAGQNRSG